MRSKRRFMLLILVVVLLGAAGGYYYYTTTVVAAAQEEDESELQTTVARRGEIVVSATGAGTIIAAQEVELGFASSGTLTELLVKVGDRVDAGDVLARIDDTDAQQSLVSAQMSLQQAAMQTDGTATTTGISYDEINLAEAEMTLAQAESDLEDLLNWEADPDEIALAEAQLAAAEASYNAARGQEAASSTNITVNNISVEQAERDLADAQGAYNEAYDPARDWELNDPRRADALKAERERASDNLLRAQEALQVAQLNYNATVASTNNSSSTNAQTSLLSAQQSLTAAQTGPTEEEIAAAQTAVQQAELSLKRTQLDIEANELNLTQAQLNVDTAEAAVENTTLTAPIAGTVTAVNYSVGESVSGAVIVLADLEQPLLEIYLDESDLNMVGLGYEADVVFDALPDDTFTGEVIQVDPELVDSNGVTAVRAVMQLNTFAKPQTLPVGLNATVEVIGGRTQNAVLVPVEALRELSEGQYAVFVMVDGEPKLRPVEVGLMDFTFAEIVSGISEGDMVTTGIVETQ